MKSTTPSRFVTVRFLPPSRSLSYWMAHNVALPIMESLGIPDVDPWESHEVPVSADTRMEMFGLPVKPDARYVGDPEWNFEVRKVNGARVVSLNRHPFAADVLKEANVAAAIKELPAELTCLSLEGLPISSVPDISRLAVLKSLRLQGCTGLSDIGPISALTGLASLDLGGCESLTDIGPLSELAGLTSLDLSQCTSLTDIGPISALAGLTSLDLNVCENLSNIGPISALTGLTSLTLFGCDSLRDISPISSLTGLTSLKLSFCTSLSDIGPLSGLTGLTSLDLSQCESLGDIGPLSGLTRLTSLDLNGCECLRDIGPLSGLTGLTSLDLSQCTSLSDIGPLSGLTGLTSLDLSQCESLGDIGPLRCLSGLFTLSLRGCPYLVEEKLISLFELSNLTDLSAIDARMEKKILLHSALARHDLGTLFLLVSSSIDVMEKSPDADHAIDIAQALRLLGGDSFCDKTHLFLNLCERTTKIRAEDWPKILKHLAEGQPVSLKGWLESAAYDAPTVLPAFVGGLLRFLADGHMVPELDTPAILRGILDLLEENNSEAIVGLGPGICQAWRALGDQAEADRWLKKLTKPAETGFKDRVLAAYTALHQICRNCWRSFRNR